MQRICVLAFVGVWLLLGAACGGSDTPPAQAPVASVQPTYAPPPATPPPTATAPQTTAPGQMATPGPTALACQNDSQCVTHRCNTQHGKCAFPCQSEADCIHGTICFAAMGVCAPKAPGQ